jgi:hypothetical protein
VVTGPTRREIIIRVLAFHTEERLVDAQLEREKVRETGRGWEREWGMGMGEGWERV